MAILGLFTNVGMEKAQDAEGNEGFKIHPLTFGVSRDIGPFNVTRTGPNSGQWFTGAISSRVIVDQNTFKIVCTIPQNAINHIDEIKEIYVYAKDSLNNDFLLCLGQPTEVIPYNPDSTITLELQLTLANIDLTSTFIFNNTQAQELADHRNDPNSHPEILELLEKHGITLPAGAYNFQRKGQSVEYPVQFDGLKASFTHAGVTFTATYNGTELNNLHVIFDGIKTTDTIRAIFNAENYPNTIEHNDGTGSLVLGVADKILTGGTYVVADKDAVYKDTDGVYKRAIADGTNKSRVAGFAFRADKTLVGSGFVDIVTGLAVNAPIYLSGTNPGKLTDFNTNVKVGLNLGSFIAFTGFAGDISTTASQEFDAVVTDAAGAGQFASTQAAIDFVPNNGRILITKLELVKEVIEVGGKNLEIVFNSPASGWKRFLGQSTVLKLSFTAVPTQGTFRFEWEGQESNDLPYNASAFQVETEFNQFNGHNGVTVSGDFSTGFTITFLDQQLYSLPTFSYVGRNEIQRFTFSAVPDNGTFRLEFNSQQTANYAFNDSVSDLQNLLNGLSNLSSVIVTGSFASGFTIEFDGTYLQDGKQPQNLIKAVTNFFFNSGVPVSVNGSPTPPINATRIQAGKTPASNLYNGSTPITISAVVDQIGEGAGPSRLINIDCPSILIQGFGLVEGFEEGLNIEQANVRIQTELHFNDVAKPFLSLDKIPGVNYDNEVLGFHKDVNGQLRLSEHPTNKKRVKITGVDFMLPNGVLLTKEINGLKVKFTGAEIDFSTGIIYAQDGITVIGTNFTVPTITPSLYKWFSINLVVSSLNVATNEANVNLNITPASSEGASADLAPKAIFGDLPVGQVLLQGALGKKEQTSITTVKDTFDNPLLGKTLILHHPLESVAFYFDDGSVPALALTADRQVPITTLVVNDFQAVVASKLQAAIDADIRFTASVIGNKVTVENTVLGVVTDADMGDTGFFSSVIVQGTDTDSTGLEDISNYNLAQLSLGSGGGGNLSVKGSMGAPLEIDPVVGIEAERSMRQLKFISSIASSGPQEITATPQIEAGSALGQEITLIGTSDTDYIKLVNGNGLYLPSPKFLKLNQTVRFIWNGSVWVVAGGDGAGLPLMTYETPIGVKDGVNQSFTLSQETVDGSALFFINGRKVSYTESSGVFTLAEAPEASQELLCWYFVLNSNSTGVRGQHEIPSGAVNDANLLFNLIGRPFSKEAMIVFINGVAIGFDKWNLLVTSTLTQIQFTSGNAPSLGQEVSCFYLVNIAQGVTIGGGPVPSGGDGALLVHGTKASPIVISTNITIDSSEQRALYFIASNGGELIPSGLQISSGSIVGQELILVGTSDVNYIRLEDGNGVELFGTITLLAGKKLYLFWDGFVWSEIGRPL